jgi:hypothetical protein
MGRRPVERSAWAQSWTSSARWSFGFPRLYSTGKAVSPSGPAWNSTTSADAGDDAPADLSAQPVDAALRVVPFSGCERSNPDHAKAAKL